MFGENHAMFLAAEVLASSVHRNIYALRAGDVALET
jgi:hypothetical protein